MNGCNGNYIVYNDYSCSLGFGTDTHCEQGNCVLTTNNQYQNCQYGCNNGACNVPTYENCNTRDNKVCDNGNAKNNDYSCAAGKGTDTNCLTGNCVLLTSTTNCANGCTNGVCNAPLKENCNTKPDSFGRCFSEYKIMDDYNACQNASTKP